MLQSNYSSICSYISAYIVNEVQTFLKSIKEVNISLFMAPHTARTDISLCSSILYHILDTLMCWHGWFNKSMNQQSNMFYQFENETLKNSLTFWKIRLWAFLQRVRWELDEIRKLEKHGKEYPLVKTGLEDVTVPGREIVRHIIVIKPGCFFTLQIEQRKYDLLISEL